MSLKRQRRMAWTLLAVGVATALVASLCGVEESLLDMMGGACAVCGLVRLVRIRRLTRDPERVQEYEASRTDERMAYLANRARSVTFAVSTVAQLAAGYLCLSVLHQELLGKVLCALTCAQCLLFTAFYRYYNKKF